MWGPRLRRVAILIAVLAGSQLGHAIIYVARFGADAGSRQASGVHGYFPALTGGLSAVAGASLMTALLVIAAGRSLRPANAIRRVRATTRFFDILPLLFAAQLALFMFQETIEGLAAGGRLPSAELLLSWGTLGQLPAAAIAAAILTWLLARLEAARGALVDAAILVLDEPSAALQPAVQPAPGAALRLAAAYPSAFRKRGPPPLR